MKNFYPLFLLFLISFFSYAQVSFTSPDTVCLGQPFFATNTSIGASNNYWTFCDLNYPDTPALKNFGNAGVMNVPTYADVEFDNGNYYMFVSNFGNGTLTRLDFGSSLANTPSGVNLGTLGGVLTLQIEGIRVKKEGANWIGYVVNWNTSRIVRLSFGNALTNTPVATDLGNIGSMNKPHYLYIWYENANWYGFTLNQGNHTFTRFSFGSSLANTPTGVNSGSLGAGNGTGASSLQQVNGQWHLFITNFISSTITRLDFGNSLLNAPVSNNLGNFGGLMNGPLAISIIKDCNKTKGYVTNLNNDNLILLDFGGSITSTPTASVIGNVLGYDGTHYISDFYRGADTLYAFFFSSYNANQLIRGALPICSNSAYPNAASTNIGPITFNQAGTYHVNLSVDFGMPTQDNECRTVVVLPCTNPVASFQSSDTVFCSNDCISFTNLSSGATSWEWSFDGGLPSWSTDQNPQQVCYTAPGSFAVRLIASNSGTTDTVKLQNFIQVIEAPPTPNISQSDDTLRCSFDPSYTSYQWYADSSLIPGATGSFYVAPSSGNYNVRVTNENGCSVAVGINVVINGIVPHWDASGIWIYPNPAGDRFTVYGLQFTTAVELELYNILGEKMYGRKPETGNPKQETLIDISGFAKGVYILRIKTPATDYKQKLIKN